MAENAASLLAEQIDGLALSIDGLKKVQAESISGLETDFDTLMEAVNKLQTAVDATATSTEIKTLEASMEGFREELKLNNMGGLVLGTLFLVVLILTIISMFKQKKTNKNINHLQTELSSIQTAAKANQADSEEIKAILMTVKVELSKIQSISDRNKIAPAAAMPTIEQIVKEANNEYQNHRRPWKALSGQFVEYVKQVQAQPNGMLYLCNAFDQERDYVLVSLGEQSYLLPNILQDNKAVPVGCFFEGAVPNGSIRCAVQPAKVSIEPNAMNQAVIVNNKGSISASNAQIPQGDVEKGLGIADLSAFCNMPAPWTNRFDGIGAMHKSVAHNDVMVGDGHLHLAINQAGPASTVIAVVTGNDAWLYPVCSNIHDPLIARLFIPEPMLRAGAIRRVIKPARAMRNPGGHDWWLAEPGGVLI